MINNTRDRATAVKIVIAGGFGVGKTTLVGTISEIQPLTTEAVITAASIGVDDLASTPSKTATTVAMDFGRITLDPTLVLYLFGTPGQTRFWFMWDELVAGAVGAVVLADTRRLADSFAPIDFFDSRGVPYVVVVNPFDGARRFELSEVRSALTVTDRTPVLACDARDRAQVRDILIALVHHALQTRNSTPVPGRSG
jgi:signal recognition particle receptor subunit beta